MVQTGPVADRQMKVAKSGRKPEWSVKVTENGQNLQIENEWIDQGSESSVKQHYLT